MDHNGRQFGDQIALAAWTKCRCDWYR